jgi:hypothetical protein
MYNDPSQQIQRICHKNHYSRYFSQFGDFYDYDAMEYILSKIYMFEHYCRFTGRGSPVTILPTSLIADQMKDDFKEKENIFRRWFRRRNQP